MSYDLFNMNKHSKLQRKIREVNEINEVYKKVESLKKKIKMERKKAERENSILPPGTNKKKASDTPIQDKVEAAILLKLDR